MDKFLLAENPLRPDQSGLWIIHMLDPISIIRCSEGHGPVPDTYFGHYSFQNSDDEHEQWTLSIYHMFTNDMLETPEQRVPKLLDRAWRWFRAYLTDEDQHINEGEPIGLN